MTQARNIGNSSVLMVNIPEKEGELEEESPEGKIFSDNTPFHLAFPQSPDFLKCVTSREVLLL